MPIARFQMPDGRVARFQVPDGTTPEQAQQMISSHLSAQASQPATQPSAADGMSTGERLLASIGQGMTRTGRAVKQGIDMGAAKIDESLRGTMVGDALRWADDKLGLQHSDQVLADTNASIEEAKKIDAPLLATRAGKVGSFIGTAAAAAPTMLIPGANTYVGAGLIGAGTGLATTEGDIGERLQGAKYGAIGGVAGKATGDLVGAGARYFKGSRDAARSAAQTANATRDATLQAARDVGYVVTPSQAGSGGLVNNTLEALGGKLKTQQAASVKNQAITDQLARKSLGLSEDAPLSPETFKAVRDTAGSAYENLRSLGTIQADKAYSDAINRLAQQSRNAGKSFPGLAKNDLEAVAASLDQKLFDAGDAIDAIRLLRDSADSAYAKGDKGIGKAYRSASTALEDMLDRAAQQSGNPELVGSFRQARQQIAKSYSIESALNQGAGTVNANKLAQQLAKGKPLSGELKTAAQFAQAFREAAQSNVTVPAFSPLDVFSGGIGVGTGNPLLVGLTASRPVARSLLLNKGYQNTLVKPPSYTPGLLERSGTGLLGSDLTNLAIRSGLLVGAINSAKQ